ncbi:hypothetical protein [Streptomyces zingiberis]|uniref:Peptidoglycan binding domain-containing protein n=1 Tax=Streptomyces zingiberis TaxID=2053010 RepID=A0ABX1BZ76_9ACTN|nr:hypothetical protein [Streptomyces zingiberis]NJQ00997.1 hypothetical protein [Streptomyces zingiberis]
MSRESDTTSSGPHGHGGAAPYPSGTPPYGTPRYPSLHPPQDATGGAETAGAGQQPSAAPEQQPRTETTLTTRIRINIPGSRPIPPVVMRTPVEDRSSAVTPGDPGPGRAGDGQAAGAAADRGREEPGKAPATGGRGGGDRTSDWFAPKKTPTPSGGTPIPGGPAAPQGGGARGGVPGGADPGSVPGARRPGGAPRPGPDAAHGPAHTPAYGTRIPGPDGPTTGPAEGDMPLPPGFRQQHGPGTPGGPGRDSGFPSHTAPPGAEQDQPTMDFGRGLIDDAPYGGHEERISSDTLVSGGHPAPAAAGPAFPAFPTDPDGHAAADGGSGTDAPRPPEPPAAEPAPPARKKGRSKLVLTAVALVVATGTAYAAGLLLDHAEVPKGTTILGVDVGGTSREEAVSRLDQALGNRVDQPLTVAVAGEKQQLKPSVLGLDVDTEASVRQAAGRDYNPVTVIGSLVGGTRAAEAEITADQEKLRAALESLAGEEGAAQDGTIRFENGKAVPVPGKPHRALDVDKSVTALSGAYRTRAETGADTEVKLPSSVRQPAVSEAEIDKAMKEFARPAMSGLVTVRTDAEHTIAFSPENSLPKFLSMKPVGGKLVDTYDLKVLKSLYGGVFDGVLVERGNGSKTPVSPEDVAGALREALRSTDPAGRVVTIETAPE